MLCAKRGLNTWPKPVDSFGKLDAVDPVLEVGVLAADMDLAVGILRDAGRLQHHLVQRRVVTLRQIMNRLLVETVDAAAGLGRQAVARHVEPFGDHRQAQGLLRGHRQRQFPGLSRADRRNLDGGLE